MISQFPVFCETGLELVWKIWKKTDGVLDFLPPRILTLIAEFWVFVFIIQFFLSQNSAVPKTPQKNLQILWFISWAFTVI